jgi:hypothetical protein
VPYDAALHYRITVTQDALWQAIERIHDFYVSIDGEWRERAVRIGSQVADPHHRPDRGRYWELKRRIAWC